MYNYYGSSPTSCALPSPGTSDNGNVMGYWYQDSANSSFSHTATYTYDGVNRLAAAVATGNATYNLKFSYDAYGNMTCSTNGQTNGPCPNWAYNPSTNQLTTSGFGYDAPGDLSQDSSNVPSHTWQWDGEGRVASADSGSTWGFTYNALGDRAQWAYTGGADQHLFDPEGTWLGNAGSYSLVSLGGRYFVVYTGSETDFIHINNLGSTTTWTSHSGAELEDILFYPWGDLWRSQGSGGYNFAGMPYYDTTTNTSFTTSRVYSPNLGRWLSPDPLGGDVTNPQSLNRYPYVMNNPTTLTDPLGLQGCPPGTTSIGTGQCAGQAVGPQAVLWGLDEFGLMDIPVVEAEWVPPSQVDMTVNGVDYPGPVVPGYWAWATIGTGIVFTQTGPTTATFVSTYPFYQTVGKFVQAGFHAAPFDLLNRFHPGQLDLRDNSLICSPHVAINKNSGGAPGVPTTGDIHLDTVNPYPSWSVAFGPGGLALTALAHGVFDVFGGGLYPGSQACK